MSTALAKAMQGDKVSDGAAKGALSAAVDKLKSLKNRAESMKEKAGAIGMAAMHIGEMQTTLFAGSFAEGYFGEDKMKVGPVDVRAGVGLAGAAVGLYQTFNGSAAGGHVLAVSNGLLGSAVASFGRRAGQSMAEKSKAGAAPDAAAAPPPPAPAAAPAPAQVAAQPNLQGEMAGMVRDIMLTPDAAGDVAGRRGKGGRRRPSRFLHVKPRQDDDESDEEPS